MAAAATEAVFGYKIALSDIVIFAPYIAVFGDSASENPVTIAKNFYKRSVNSGLRLISIDFHRTLMPFMSPNRHLPLLSPSISH